jgi:hypothetical protein
MIIDFFRDIFSCGTRVFVYVLVHVMCLCVYVSMVCQRCMLYDNMYLDDKNLKIIISKLNTIFVKTKNQTRSIKVPPRA